MLQIAQRMRWLIKSAWHPQCLKQTNGHRWASNPPAENLSNAPPIAVPSSWGTGLVSGQHQIDWHPTVRAQASRDSRGHNHHGCNHPYTPQQRCMDQFFGCVWTFWICDFSTDVLPRPRGILLFGGIPVPVWNFDITEFWLFQPSILALFFELHIISLYIYIYINI